jgi:LmbE family N-acetylglucosaminyl deacetylase
VRRIAFVGAVTVLLVGLVVLGVRPAPPAGASPPPGSALSTGAAPTVLPIVIPPTTVPVIRDTVIFYSPHEDDEVLSMGELIADYVRRGWRVEVVLVTDGGASGARVKINRTLAAMSLPPLSRPAFVNAREREFVAALARLGVSATHVHFAGWQDSHLTVAEAAATIGSYAAQFPGALHITMSEWDVNPDHSRLGMALAQLSPTNAARWVVFHRYWASATFRQSCVFVDVPITVAAVRAAAAVYARWDPVGGWYAIGVKSVAGDFRQLHADPRDLVCTTPGMPMTPTPTAPPSPSPP